MDFSGYQPSPAALAKLQAVDFVAVVGPSAVGKSSLMQAAAAQDPLLTNVLTQTSRVPRPGERDGVDIHFRSKEEMLERIARREYVQVAPSLLGEMYATAPEDYPSEGIALLAVLADALDTFLALPFKSFRAIFIVPPNAEVWQERLKTHGFSPENLQKRLAEARRSFQYALASPSMQFVINDDFARATEDFIGLATQQPLAFRQQQDQQRAKNIIQEILKKI